MVSASSIQRFVLGDRFGDIFLILIRFCIVFLIERAKISNGSELMSARSKKRSKNESRSGKCLRNDRLACRSWKSPELVSGRHFLARFLERNCSLSGQFGFRTAHFRDPQDRETKGYPFTNLRKSMDFRRFVFWGQCTILWGKVRYISS